MFYYYEVATVLENEDLVHEFDQRLCWMRQKGYSTQIDIYNGKGYDFIYLMLQGEEKDEVFKEEDIVHIFQHQLAEILAEHIIKDWEGKLIWKKVLKLCRQYQPAERNAIFKKAYDFLSGFHENESLNLFINFNRKNRIMSRILEHIKRSDKIIIEGFIRFGLPDYLQEIDGAVKIAQEEFKNEKEYNEFIRLLQYFVNSQVPKTYEINIMPGPQGSFYFWDGDNAVLEEKYVDYYRDLCADEVSLDDVLISVLITIAPRRIVLHNMEKCRCHQEALDIIRKVFGERIQICPGCRYCCLFKEDKDFTW
ncbi:putative sporulation protein YtxC [Thermosyntropha lipolytica DSM 11003]|uniref:Putative sporulation protein YtxC n=1 Tax=Thermosyntropha lipolytica DSM 11003 TaxID=1123382 RepID=A0A1M5K4K8_9FIRM|nr:putative sporulation protein YtxC [Thermosyntropha lipolytica]SHG47540.1 putative sporulation protein YtxC [Thermosyntropha lipolytica DSM 11003]